MSIGALLQRASCLAQPRISANGLRTLAGGERGTQRDLLEAARRSVWLFSRRAICSARPGGDADRDQPLNRLRSAAPS